MCPSKFLQNTVGSKKEKERENLLFCWPLKSRHPAPVASLSVSILKVSGKTVRQPEAASGSVSGLLRFLPKSKEFLTDKIIALRKKTRLSQAVCRINSHLQTLLRAITWPFVNITELSSNRDLETSTQAGGNPKAGLCLSRTARTRVANSV